MIGLQPVPYEQRSQPFAALAKISRPDLPIPMRRQFRIAPPAHEQAEVGGGVADISLEVSQSPKEGLAHVNDIYRESRPSP